MSDKYKRDSSYRERFIEANPPKNGKYRCVYCGRKISKDDMEVDHVIAVGRVKKNWLYRLCVPNGVNDIDNLVPSCHKCNHKKGNKGGFWAIRGHFWRIILPIVIFIKVTLFCITFWLLTIIIMGNLQIAFFPILLDKLILLFHMMINSISDGVLYLIQQSFEFIQANLKSLLFQ